MLYSVLLWEGSVAMGTVHDLYESFWIKEIQHNDEQYDTDEYWLIEYLAAFQKGDFSRKADFAALFTKSGDREVFCVGMRIFMAVCSHDDFELLMDFFENPDDYYDIRAFLVSVTESLSYQSIPYLLALHDLWADTVIAAEIAFILNGMLHFAPPDGLYEGKYGEYATEQIGEAFMAFGEEYDLNSYYYDGKEVFLGDLTKLLMGTAIYCMRNNKLFYSTEILSILSDSTGMACPVKTDEYVDEEQIGAILKYIDQLPKERYQRGCKYFYGHLIQ